MDILYGILLFLHVLGATVWTGGHLVLALVILPGVLRDHSPERLLRFEAGYEKLGMAALLIQVVTGVWLAHRLLPDFGEWLDFSNPVTRVLALKFLLLALTAGVAVHARLRVIPRLGADNLRVMAWHIAAVTLLAVLFVFAGVSFRTGWLY